MLALSANSFAAIAAGELIITEFMANPAAVSDTNGEWFEIFNSTASAIDINGLVLRDEGSNSHTVSSTTPLWIEAGAYFVLGRNTDSASNGGYQADYGYSNFSLNNSSDAIILEWDGAIIDALVYSSSDGLTVAGNSAELTATGFQLTAINQQYGLGDIGTPGSTGSFAPSPVPVPAAAWLFGSALGLLVGCKRKS
jgi:hypothetical protein